MKIIAITACPTGVAHTYLAEANLKKNALKKASLYSLKRMVP